MGDETNTEDAAGPAKPIYENDPNIWIRYVKHFVKGQKNLEANDKLNLRQAPDLPKFPLVDSQDDFTTSGYPVSLFNPGETPELPNRLKPEEEVQVWKRMEENPPVDMSCFIPDQLPSVSKTDSGRWPGVSPCNKPAPKNKKKKRFGEGCLDSDGAGIEDDFSNNLELWHARIPPTCPSARSDPPMVDRAVGLNRSLVSGDYVLTVTVSKEKGNRVYANICLRGLTGMRLSELTELRAREKTWKWCFYQAVIALLAKTQLRYKHTWSGNVDYIYDRGWNLFTHIGSINVNTVGRQKFDDVGVYNYAYDVEVELVHEVKDVPVPKRVPWNFVEVNHGRVIEVERKDLVNFKSRIGTEKKTDQQTAPVHKATKRIEKWFDELPFRYQNCIFRTPMFCLAFWKEGAFWYLYNPYRCNVSGFWDDDGYACIVKFCSRNGLRRHLMVLLLRAYAHDFPKRETEELGFMKKDVFTVQIFQMIYTRSELTNDKLMERRAPKPAVRPVKKRSVEVCQVQSWGEEYTNVEDPGWLKELCITWARPEATSKRIAGEKQRWHQYYVEEPHKLFSLWGEIHPSQSIFDVNNRGKQTYACYVVCAGMTRITAPEYWTPKTLDAVVMCGDKYHAISIAEAESKGNRQTWGRYLARNFKVGETVFHGELMPGVTGRLYSRSSRSLWKTLHDVFLRHPFGVVTCESTCVGVFKFCGAYYMCDVKSTGPPIFQYGGGVVYLIRTTCFAKLMNVLILTIGSTECSVFEVNPIQIFNAIDVGPTACLERKITRVSSCSYGSKKATKKPRKKSKEQDFCKGQESPCDAAGYMKP